MPAEAEGLRAFQRDLSPRELAYFTELDFVTHLPLRRHTADGIVELTLALDGENR